MCQEKTSVKLLLHFKPNAYGNSTNVAYLNNTASVVSIKASVESSKKISAIFKETWQPLSFFPVNFFWLIKHFAISLCLHTFCKCNQIKLQHSAIKHFHFSLKRKVFFSRVSFFVFHFPMNSTRHDEYISSRSHRFDPKKIDYTFINIEFSVQWRSFLMMYWPLKRFPQNRSWVIYNKTVFYSLLLGLLELEAERELGKFWKVSLLVRNINDFMAHHDVSFIRKVKPTQQQITHQGFIRSSHTKSEKAKERKNKLNRSLPLQSNFLGS